MPLLDVMLVSLAESEEERSGVPWRVGGNSLGVGPSLVLVVVEVLGERESGGGFAVPALTDPLVIEHPGREVVLSSLVVDSVWSSKVIGLSSVTFWASSLVNSTGSSLFMAASPSILYRSDWVSLINCVATHCSQDLIRTIHLDCLKVFVWQNNMYLHFTSMILA